MWRENKGKSKEMEEVESASERLTCSAELLFKKPSLIGRCNWKMGILVAQM